jgi:hypothetical protein
VPRSRRFPAPWRAELIPGGYIVRDANGQALGNESAVSSLIPMRRPWRSSVGADRSPPDEGHCRDGLMNPLAAEFYPDRRDFRPSPSCQFLE